MKVLTICTDYLPRKGGISNHIHYLNKNLRKLGVDAIILHIVDESDKSKHMKMEEEELDGNIVYRLFLKGGLKKFNKFIYHPYIGKIIDKIGRFDIIHTHEFMTTEFLVPEKYQDRFIWTNHTSKFFFFFNPMPDFSVNQSFIRYIKHKFLGWIAIRKIKRAKFIITVSKFYEKLTKNNLRINNVVTIPNGVEIEKFSIPKSYSKFNFPKDKVKILIPARWSKVKGIHNAIEILKGMLQTKYRMKLLFIFAGNENYDDENYYLYLMEELKDLDSNSYKLLGNVEFEKLPYLYNEVDIVLLPSEFETASITVLEAFAAKKIILASKVGAIPEFVKDFCTGFLFGRGNVKEAIAKLTYVIENLNAQPMRKIRENAFLYCKQNHDWSIIAKRVKEVYEEVHNLNFTGICTSK